MLWKGHLAGLYLLFGLAAIDFIVYQLLPNVTVCYLCQSVYRGVPAGGHGGFYLGDEEKYKHLRKDWAARIAKPPSSPQETPR